MPRSYKAGHRGAQPLLRSGRGNPASPVARPGGQVSHIATKAARPDHFRDRAQRSLAAILALTVVCQTSIEPKFSPQFEFDKPPSEDSNSDVSGPARRRTAWVGSGARGQPRKRRLFSWNDRTVCVGADKSEHCREFKEMNFHFAHQSSNPTTPARVGLCVRFLTSPATSIAQLCRPALGDRPSPSKKKISN